MATAAGIQRKILRQMQENGEKLDAILAALKKQAGQAKKAQATKEPKAAG